MSSRRWWIVVPVKPPAVGKSRLAPVPAGRVRSLARATIRAAASARQVERVLVVTADPRMPLHGIPRTERVAERSPRGIAAAVRRGASRVPRRPVAVLLGDIPGLEPDDLDAALAAAGRAGRGFVRDAAGTGTTLVTARAGVRLLSAFGPDSAARHLGLGLVDLGIPPGSTLRHDVDTPDDLRALGG